MATFSTLPVVATLAGVDPFGTVGPTPVLDTALGCGLALALLACCWLGLSLREGQALSLVVIGWALWALRFQTWAPAEVVALASAAGVLVVLGSALALGRLRRGVMVLGAAALLVHVLAYQPFSQPGCGSVCVETWAPLAGLWGAKTALGIAVGLEWLVLLAILVGPFSPWVLLLGLTTLAAVAADSSSWWRWPTLESTIAEDRLRTAAVVVLAVCLGATIVRRMLARRAVHDLVQALSAREDFPGVAFAVPGAGRWVAVDGRRVLPPSAGLRLPGPDGHAAVSVPRSWRAEDSLSPVDRFLLDSARLTVVARARLADLRASQQRIVAAADAERRRVERDLHDGIQQQLVGARLLLASREDPGVAGAERKVGEAAAALRNISHGALLSVLVTDGLQAALEDLVVGTDTQLVGADLPPLDASVERAAYDVVAGAVRTTRQPFTVRLEVRDRRFSVICDPSPGLPEQMVLDRVAATGGRVQEEGATMKAQWPCES